jgi:hypothetical protein
LKEKGKEKEYYKTMDPTIYACEQYNSFLQPKPMYDSERMLPEAYRRDPSEAVSIEKTSLTFEPFQTLLRPKYVDVDSFDSLLMTESISGASMVRNGFTEHVPDALYLPSTPFKGRMSLLLANVDAIYKLTGFFGGLAKPRIEDLDFTFLILDDLFFEWSRYLQYRLERAKGFVYLRSSYFEQEEDQMKDLDQNLGYILTTYLTLESSDQDTSDLVALVRKVMLGEGVELVCAQQAPQILSLPSHRTLREVAFVPILLQRIRIALETCKHEGNFMTVVYDTTTEISAQVLYLLSQCFESIQFLKALSNDAISGEKVLVALTRRSDEDIAPYLNLLKRVTTEHSPTDEVLRSLHPSSKVSWIHSILDGVPSSFQAFLTEQNNLLLEQEMEIVSTITPESKEIEAYSPLRYNFQKASLVWSL